ncbi:MAG: TonB-dependent receptor [Proteobacteria bacterium]|nr:TonB-dependent receptor [Pseudomonadota bacterium]
MNRTLLASAICASLLASGIAYAQNAPAPQAAQDQTANPQQLGTITVTGTHIRKATIETAQPVIVLDRTAIEHQGFNTTADILQNLTVSGTPPISRAQVLASGENVGGYYADLRNLGASRTLILLNGKRLGTNTYGLQDLQQVPIAAIERIEVLKDGASAIYGSDAIAGVINIITRSNFNGAEASGYWGQYDQGDGTAQTYSATFGAKSERGSVTLVAEYGKQDPVWASDRWFSAYPSTNRHPTAGWTAVSQWGAFKIPGQPCNTTNATTSPLGRCTLNFGSDYTNPANWHGTNAAGGTSDLTNSNEEMMVQTGLEHKSVFASTNYSISDHVQARVDILYNHRDTQQTVAGYPLQLTTFKQGNPASNSLDAKSYYNPFGVAVSGYRRGWEVPRVTDNALTTYRIGGTLSGDFEIANRSWNWDVGAYSNQNNILTTQHGDFNLLAVNQAVGPSFLNSSGVVQCGTAAAPIAYGNAPGSCIPWNPLIPAGQVGPGSLQNNAALQQFLFPYYHTTGRTSTIDYSANITGSVFTLPAGDLSVAAGIEYRRDKGSYSPDAMFQSGVSTSLSSGPTQGAYNVKEAYVEVDVPLLKDLPFAHELSLNVAARRSHYSSFGSTTNPKYSITWRPIEEVLVRGTYAKGFRAPGIHDLFGGISGTFDYYIDPCSTNQAAGSNPAVAQRCTSGFGGQAPVPANYKQLGQGGLVCTSFPCQTGTQFFSGANPTLKPELATSKTAGVVYSPKFVPGNLDLTLDWYNITITNALVGDTVTSMLNDCYIGGVTSRCVPSLFTRDPSTGALNYALRGLVNAGVSEAEGWDFGVNYRLPENKFGTFTLTWNTTYTSKLDSKADNKPTTPVSPSNSWYGNFRTRSNASLDWALGPWGATWTARYYSSMREKCVWNNTSAGGPECNMPGYILNNVVMNLNQTGSNTFHDMQVRYTAPWKGTISFGVNNVFGHWAAPMYSNPNSQYSYYGGFDIGRFYYLRYNQRF